MQIHRAYDGGDWIYGTSFVQDKGDKSIWWHIDEHDEVSMVGEPEPSIGEIDKNGRATFLNDIIKHNLGIGVIRYANCEYYVEWRSGALDKSTVSILDNTYEVIGNLTDEKL